MASCISNCSSRSIQHSLDPSSPLVSCSINYQKCALQFEGAWKNYIQSIHGHVACKNDALLCQLQVSKNEFPENLIPSSLSSNMSLKEGNTGLAMSEFHNFHGKICYVAFRCLGILFKKNSRTLSRETFTKEEVYDKFQINSLNELQTGIGHFTSISHQNLKQFYLDTRFRFHHYAFQSIAVVQKENQTLYSQYLNEYFIAINRRLGKIVCLVLVGPYSGSSPNTRTSLYTHSNLNLELLTYSFEDLENSSKDLEKVSLDVPKLLARETISKDLPQLEDRKLDKNRLQQELQLCQSFMQTVEKNDEDSLVCHELLQQKLNKDLVSTVCSYYREDSKDLSPSSFHLQPTISPPKKRLC